MKLMNPANEQDRIFAARMGLIFDGWFGRAHSANRFSDTYGTGASAKTAEAVLRFSGLEAWTESGRKAVLLVVGNTDLHPLTLASTRVFVGVFAIAQHAEFHGRLKFGGGFTDEIVQSLDVVPALVLNRSNVLLVRLRVCLAFHTLESKP